ncbi:GNAT family N-acetyltransferase [Thioclava sp. FR2]|uniref:GNAT family N-acetyltransferase n=1 Tax=Thioclava sp. FR2 TaxID=3445780 RepID=UPI003EBB2FC6
MERTKLDLFTRNDAQWLVDRHAELYAQEEGYDASFPQLVAKIIAEFLDGHDPVSERGWVAILDGKRVGSIFCVKDSEDESGQTAKLRLFLLEPSARGTGLSKRLIETCLQFAREAGYQHMRLWTHASHAAACRLYEKYGFSCTKSWGEHTFGQDVISQIWERPL